ncbi:Cystathionine gamma-synthase [Candidatus Ornithobacterium hominis]|uniref:trans-sulfuration enzyme family protein n=1 Tax=Candidatus Ornithobacterium hominis TaxID=2497989 RepID=UPI000E5B538F|nr:aminotransferase class V-fold PLP-dependent enzyme [Candidatus Ornithobacterium hominis]SZD71819.1 Cystathionine gamma-synthase [Candidatus Ornithobacterium hominis]
MKLETLLANITAHSGIKDPYAATHLPIYNTATFDLSKQYGDEIFDYSRSGNPTRQALERIFALAEEGNGACCTNTGLAAVALLFESVLAHGEKIIVEKDCYGGTFRLLSVLAEKNKIHTTFLDLSDLENLEKHLKENKVKLVLCESPTNPGLKVLDLEAIALICHKHGALFAVDNSMATFASQKPLSLGADFSVFSTTKYVSGHGSITAGVLVSKDEAWNEKVQYYCNAQGRAQSPMDVFITSLGLSTLVTRIEKQAENAGIIYQFLNEISQISNLRFVGSPEHPQFELAKRQMKYTPAVLTFEMESEQRAHNLMENTRFIGQKVSFGTSDSRMEIPSLMSHASKKSSAGAENDFSNKTIRFSVGLEHPDDLKEDILQALKN